MWSFPLLFYDLYMHTFHPSCEKLIHQYINCGHCRRMGKYITVYKQLPSSFYIIHFLATILYSQRIKTNLLYNVQGLREEAQ
jgi:hypothetical protein